MERKTILEDTKVQATFDKLLGNGGINNVTHSFSLIIDHAHEYHQELMFRHMSMLGMDSQKVIVSLDSAVGGKAGMITGTYTVMLRTVYNEHMVPGVEVTTTFVSPLLNTSKDVCVFVDGETALVDLVLTELYRQLNQIGEERYYAG